MRHTEDGYAPQSGYLNDLLHKMPQFHDAEFEKLYLEGTSGEQYNATQPHPPKLGPSLDKEELMRDLKACEARRHMSWLMSPESIYGKRVRYAIQEYFPLLDSSDMTITDWVKIASDIELHYAFFDAFIILHGTDTMAYTASALSFMLSDLGKTVIITGSQVPFAEVRNDAVDNFLGALTIAGHFVIPEVGLYFCNELLRGNRSSKLNALDLDAFDSPNLSPLVKVGVNIGTSLMFALLIIVDRCQLAISGAYLTFHICIIIM